MSSFANGMGIAAVGIRGKCQATDFDMEAGVQMNARSLNENEAAPASVDGEEAWQIGAEEKNKDN